MIWLSWRHLRTEFFIVSLILLGMAALFVPTGLNMSDDYRDHQLAACVSAPTEQCDLLIDQFEDRFATVIGITDWFAVLPILFATLIAAPFVLELERRSYRLAWTQSITRQRWTMVKLGAIVIGVLVSSSLLSLLLTWWRTPLDQLLGRLDPGVFQIEGIALPMYCLFSAALVIACGTFMRRTVPTIAIAAVIFIVIRVVFETWLRPHYQAAETGDASTLASTLKSAWILQRQTNTSGITIVDYQPGDRFWQFQLIESAIFLGISALLIAGSGLWIVRKFD